MSNVLFRRFDDPAASPLRAVYHDWQRAKEAYQALPEDCSDEADEAAFQVLIGFEDLAARFEPHTLEDMAFKVIIADDHGDMQGNVHQVALVKMAYRIAGIAAPHLPKGGDA